MAAPQAAGRFKEVGEEDITRLRGMTLFGMIKQMQHLCGVASMIVSPSGALSPSGFALGWQSSPGGYNHAGNPYRDVTFVYYNSLSWEDPIYMRSDRTWPSITSVVFAMMLPMVKMPLMSLQRDKTATF